MRGSEKAPARAIILFAAVLLASGPLVASSSAWPDDANVIRAGRELAVKACGSCHVVATPPSPQHAAPLAGPSFEEIAKGSKAAPDALRVFLLSTHSSVSHPGNMPRPALTEDQIRLISAYVSSLRERK